jgi:hypothetical protein
MLLSLPLYLPGQMDKGRINGLEKSAQRISRPSFQTGRIHKGLVPIHLYSHMYMYIYLPLFVSKKPLSSILIAIFTINHATKVIYQLKTNPVFENRS